MTKFEQMLQALDKGTYSNFTDNNLLTVELMTDFDVSHNLTAYAVKAFYHYEGKVCDGCVHKPKLGDNFKEECGACKRFYSDMWESKQ